MPAFLSVIVLAFFDALKTYQFPLLVIVSVITGCELAYQRAKRVGLNLRLLVNGVIWMVCCGFVVSHWVAEILYHPERVAENPLVLLKVWTGISSFGGFIGGVGAGWLYFRLKKAAFLPYAEAILFGVVPAWVVARLGCTIAFDHPGLPTDFFLGMADAHGVVRHNLGFYEMLVNAGITAALYSLRNVRPFEGFHAVLVLFLYAPMRLLLDGLRVAEKKYWGMAPGQFLAAAFLCLGAAILVRGLRKRLKQKGDISPRDGLTPMT